jgi:syntaxin 5
MSEIGGMVARLGQMTYTQSIMIENIGTNTQEAYDNVEAGANEVKKMLDDVKSNRGLLIKIFLIVIVTSVVYILLFA